MTLPEPADRNSRGAATRCRAALALGWTAAVFSFSVGLLLASAWLQGRRHDPLQVEGIGILRARLAANPQDEALRRAIREADALARRAFFTTQRQLRLGAGLALAGVAIALAAFQAAIPARPPNPGRHTEDSPRAWLETRAARRGVAVLGAAALAALAAAAIFAPGPTPDPGPVDAPSAGPPPDGEHPVPAPPAPAGVASDPRRWPNFRGPGGLGVAAGDAPVAWDGAAGGNVRWKVPVPRRGFSSPVVWDDALFLTGGDASGLEVFCFDAHTGALRWRQPVPADADAKPRVTDDTGYAAATPATDGERVYAVFATGDLAAFDFEGREVWRRALGVPENPYGHASSLLVHGGLLYVQFDHNAEAVLLALDAATGATRWEAERDVISWASPALVDLAGRLHLVLMSSRSVAGYDPATGRLLWKEDLLDGEVGASPAFADGVVVAANEHAVGAGLRPPPGGGAVEVAWKTYDYLPDVASPVAHAGRVYVALSDGVVACLGLDDGAARWTHEFDRGFYASPVIAGGRVYALDRDGVMHVFADGPEYREIGRAALGEPASATPAFAHGRVYLRGADHLFAIETAPVPAR